jgi:nucleoside-diphosphate-sugar epimerase
MEEPDAPGDWSPGSPYAASKAGATAFGRLFHELYGLPVASLRPFLCYGPGQPDLRKLVPYVVRSMLRGEQARVGSGRRPIDWVYVDDVAEAFVAASAARGIDGRVLDIGTGRLTTAREVVERIHAAIGGAPPPRFGALPDRPLERARAADVETTARLLGWRARTHLDAGLALTIAEARTRLSAAVSPGPA